MAGDCHSDSAKGRRAAAAIEKLLLLRYVFRLPAVLMLPTALSFDLQGHTLFESPNQSYTFI
jgi:hypothetical protein